MRRYLHSLSHYKLASHDLGELIPILCTEVLPGDSFQHKTNLFLRGLPQLAPLMHPTHAQIHHWFVPTRLGS